MAERLARAGTADRTAVVSDEQTAGRGRAGRSWLAPRGSGLLCTLILRPAVAPRRLPLLSLVTAVAVAEAIEQLAGSPAQLKWPNDVWIGADPDRQKVAGILMTSRLGPAGVEVALGGIGINLTTRPADLPPGATSLLESTGIRIAPSALLPVLLEQFDDRYRDFLDRGGGASLEAWRGRAALLDEHVSIVVGDETRTGVFTGVDDEGALLLRDATGTLHRIVAGDLTRGPRPVGHLGGELSGPRMIPRN
ncbi:MAG: biotin--[acetyl-CoA-carboxylase] ligase [Thermomicrobiales bacterium]|nr:biotin--[acetyl-CoA-carboxylase] ligase [Thermomicrobiales bacterium]